MKLQTFTGFRGKSALLEIQGIKFLVLAPTAKKLEHVCNFILRDSGMTFSPEMCQGSIIVHSSVLPKSKTKTSHEQTDPS